MQMKEGMLIKYQRNKEKNVGMFPVIPILLHPKSRGTIRLQSNDPFDSPLIDPNYLDHPDDIRTFLRGKRYLTQV
jgi:choline dehydrogenase-like flavoprotein